MSEVQYVAPSELDKEELIELVATMKRTIVEQEETIAENNRTIAEQKKTIAENNRCLGKMHGLMERKNKKIRAGKNRIFRLERSVAIRGRKLEREDAVWRHVKKRDPNGHRQHQYETMEALMADEEMCHVYTGHTPEEFESLFSYAAWKIAQTRLVELESRKNKTQKNPTNIPKFDTESGAGNRCRLPMRQIVFLVMARIHTSMTEQMLAGMFGVDQTTVSRYISSIIPILTDLPVSPEDVTRKIKEA